MLCAVALGANLPSRAGSPQHTLQAALHRLSLLPLTQLLAASSLRTTNPEGPGTSGQPPYANACASMRTLLTPRGLLALLLEIEKDFGRVRTHEGRNAPRTLDLDLLVFGNQIINDQEGEPAVVVPHPRLHERRFVLEPLAEILPDMIIPAPAGAGPTTVRAMLARLPAAPAP